MHDKISFFLSFIPKISFWLTLSYIETTFETISVLKLTHISLLLKFSMKIPFISIAKLNVSAKKLSPFYRNTNDLSSGASSIPNLPVTSSHIYKSL